LRVAQGVPSSNGIFLYPFTVDTNGLMSAALQWSKVDNATGYRISRATSETGDYKQISDLSGNSNCSYTDTSCSYRNALASTVTQSDKACIAVNASLSFGYSLNSNAYQLMIGGKGFEKGIENSFTATWSDSAKGNAAEYQLDSNNTEDVVVVVSVPYDVYVYNIYDAGKKSQVNVNIPYRPVIKAMSLKDYNEIVSANKDVLPNTPVIGTDVLKHNTGDPRSYPSSMDTLSNTEDNTVIEGSSFIEAGVRANRFIRIQCQHRHQRQHRPLLQLQIRNYLMMRH
jgi:hypothetical protein